MLEPCDGKLSRTVLRGEGGREAPALPGAKERRDMFKLFKKKQPQPEIRDVLFGDLPITEWPSESASSDTEPWVSFAQARHHLNSGQKQEAVDLLQKILVMPGLESRHYLQAWHFLREFGIHPDVSVAKELLGVIVEVSLQDGLDIVAAYTDGTARYFNQSGAAVIWEAPDDSLHQQIKSVLEAGKVVVDQIGPWEESRPAAPPKGQARISMLTPSGLHFVQAPFDALATDQLGGAVIASATQLMQSLITKTEKEKA